MLGLVADDPSMDIVAGMTEGAIRGLLAPITDFVSAVFGAPVKEYAAYVTDAIRARRFELQVEVFSRANAMCEAAGIAPQRVDWKILVPLLDAAGNEDSRDNAM